MRAFGWPGNHRQVRDSRLPLDFPRRPPNAEKITDSSSMPSSPPKRTYILDQAKSSNVPKLRVR